MTVILLNILIPTRNRYDHLEHCINQFLDLAILLAPVADISITVSDNSQAQFYNPEFSDRFPNIHFVRPPTELPSAEENLYFGLQKIGPGIIWFFGDDDLFEMQLSTLLRAILQSFQADSNCKAVFFHDHFIDGEGNLLYSQIPKRSEVSSEVSSEELVISNGLLNGFSGFSNWIIKFDRKNLETFLEIDLGQSPIYSHTFKILKHLSGFKIIEVNLPLISYRKNTHDTIGSNNWLEFAKSQNEIPSYTWTLNLVNKLDAALSEKHLKAETLKSLLEEDSVGSNFLLTGYILRRFLGSLNEYPKDGVLFKEDITKVYNFYHSYQLLPSTILASLHLMQISALNGKSQSKLASEAAQLIKVIDHREAILGSADSYLGRLSGNRVYSQGEKVILKPFPGYKVNSKSTRQGESYEVNSLTEAFELDSLFIREESESKGTNTIEPTLIRLIQIYDRLKTKLPTWIKRLAWRWLWK
jgi:hypothetical protein